MMSKQLMRCSGGSVALPDMPLTDRRNGGNLIVLPPRPVWDRTALTRSELIDWSLLVAATAEAMLHALPQLRDGCINYWDAGNWALNAAAEPPGPKTATQFRTLHLHLIGRSPASRDSAWRWGEAPVFPRFADAWRTASAYERLTDSECGAIADRVSLLLDGKYAMEAA